MSDVWICPPCLELCLAFAAVSRRRLLRFVGYIELSRRPLFPVCRSASGLLIVLVPTDRQLELCACRDSSPCALAVGFR